MAVAAGPTPRVGELLRSWRQRRNLIQLELALDSEVSTRHLSFIETGRARPSREMVLHLAEQLAVPLRDRNGLLLAAGYAPLHGERPADSAEMQPVREALDRFLRAHEPYPAVLVDRYWNLVTANAATGVLTDGVAPHLLEPPANALRATLHPEGMAPRIVNLAEWSAHLLHLVRRRAATTGDEELRRLHAELAAYPGGDSGAPRAASLDAEIVLPLRLRTAGGVLSFLSTQTTFGTAADITVEELSIEAFYPTHAATAAALRGEPRPASRRRPGVRPPRRSARPGGGPPARRRARRGGAPGRR
jgi:transcriptional regulator with XRE-family HTH domain